MVSIIIRNRNNSATIFRAVSSAVNQTLSPSLYEVIIVDDGSNDNSLEKIFDFRNKLIIIKTKGIGPIKALNLGIQKATGKFFTILDADDELPANALEELLDKINATGSVAVYGNYREIINNQAEIRSTKENIFDTIAGGILFEKKRVLEFGLYDESLFFPEYDLLIKLMSKYIIVHLDKVVYSYFRHPQSLTADREKVIEGIKQINQKYRKKFPIRKY